MKDPVLTTNEKFVDDHKKRMKIAVVGLGAIGGVVAGSLATLNRYDVVVCVRKAVERLIVERPDDTVEVRVHALTEPASAKVVDWVLLCTKAHQIPTVWLSRLCGPKTRVADPVEQYVAFASSSDKRRRYAGDLK